MKSNELQTIKDYVKENTILREQLNRTLDEKEELVHLCKSIETERQYIEKRYENMKSSKLGRFIVWNWKRRSKKVW